MCTLFSSEIHFLSHVWIKYMERKKKTWEKENEKVKINVK